MKFGVVVEKDADGHYIASVPELLGCHTQVRTLDEVMRRVKEAISRSTWKPREKCIMSALNWSDFSS